MFIHQNKQTKQKIKNPQNYKATNIIHTGFFVGLKHTWQLPLKGLPFLNPSSWIFLP